MTNWLWRNSGILATFVFFAVIEIAFLGLSFGIGVTMQDHLISCSVVVAAVPVGWIVAVVLTPDTHEQAGRFKRGGAALSAVLTGYLIGKSEDAIKRLLEPAVLFRPHVGFRLLAFAASFLAAFVAVFVHREYRDSTAARKNRAES